MKKKILFFVGGNYFGGLEIVTITLIKGLKENNYDCRCVLSGWSKNNTFKNKLIDLGITFYDVKLGWIYLRKLKWTIVTLLHYPAAFLKCKKIISDFKPDVFHFVHYSAPLMLYPLIRRRSIYVLHETHLPTKTHLLIYKILNKKIDFFISVSKHISYTLQNLHVSPDKIKLIYNGIDLSPISTNMGIDDKIHLAIIGQVAPWKGHDILIHAIKYLKDDTIKNVHLNIYGSNNNDYSKYLKTLIEYHNLQSYVSWKGFIEDQEEIYKKMNVIVVPSVVEESFSLTAAEGMIRGKAVIVSNKGGMMELIDHGINGLIFQSGNAIELSACLAELVNDKEKIKFFGANARKKAIQNYSYKTMTRKYLDLYEL